MAFKRPQQHIWRTTMNKTELKQIQKQGHFDIGRLLTEDELRELAYLEVGSSCFTWGDILDYVTNNWLNYSIDFIKEVQSNHAKDYAAEHHTSKAKALKHVERDTQAFFAYKLRNELLKSSTKKSIELMKQLQRGGYFKFFE